MNVTKKAHSIIQETYSAQKPIAFIENKPMDFQAIANLLEESQRRNHWANYGPATQYLEEFLADKLNLPKNKSVIMCKSGTAALHTLVQLEELKAQKKLNWVISSFGFIASNIGCLSDATIVDCDETGMLSLTELKALPTESWDGVVITNIFGLCRDISAYEKLCKQLGKKLIVDNAVGLFASWRHTSSPNEAISFHQTKPWGIGEGGCVIIESKDGMKIRDLICFGRGRIASERAFFSNEKMADINAASIMSWLQQAIDWYPAYAEQANRVETIALENNLTTLQPLESGKPYGNIPLFSKSSLSVNKLENNSITLMKYYSPLTKTPIASNIYDKIFSFPCHREVSYLPDQALSELLKKISE